MMGHLLSEFLNIEHKHLFLQLKKTHTPKKKKKKNQL
jgi:hypothetical protein